ncbi:MAG: MMPL family transporter, partial [Caldisericia bacterium]|nr:MMPL family transporter [Caldisericia bacterium]
MRLKRLFKTNDYSLKKLSGWGILFQYRSWIFLAYSLLLILSIWGMVQLKPTYDLFSFLPKSVESMKGISIIRSNQGYSDSLWLMLPAKPKSDTILLKETLLNIPNVAEITWIDSLQNPAYSDTFLADEVRETFLSGDKTILEIKLTTLMSNQEKGETIQRIQSLIPVSADLGGEAVIIESLRRTTDRESKYYTMLAIISIALLLSLLLRSWKKPLLVLASMGCTILMTMGSAYYSGTISFLTKSITPSILLGITMDYALFLIHRMEEELPRHLEKKDAIVAAVRKSFLPIAASALTTFAGLIS